VSFDDAHAVINRLRELLPLAAFLLPLTAEDVIAMKAGIPPKIPRGCASPQSDSNGEAALPHQNAKP